MQNARNKNMNAPYSRSPAPYADRFRDKLKGPHDARRNYDKYLALAQAEAQNGNSVEAENYYQHAEHYFRSRTSGR
jgi:uncharacterized protein DUF4167